MVLILDGCVVEDNSPRAKAKRQEIQQQRAAHTAQMLRLRQNHKHSIEQQSFESDSDSTTDQDSTDTDDSSSSSNAASKSPGANQSRVWNQFCDLLHISHSSSLGDALNIYGMPDVEVCKIAVRPHCYLLVGLCLYAIGTAAILPSLFSFYCYRSHLKRLAQKEAADGIVKKKRHQSNRHNIRIHSKRRSQIDSMPQHFKPQESNQGPAKPPHSQPIAAAAVPLPANAETDSVDQQSALNQSCPSLHLPLPPASASPTANCNSASCLPSSARTAPSTGADAPVSAVELASLDSSSGRSCEPCASLVVASTAAAAAPSVEQQPLVRNGAVPLQQRRGSRYYTDFESAAATSNPLPASLGRTSSASTNSKIHSLSDYSALQ